LTRGEVVWWADARRRDEWQHTSALLAMFANVHRNPKKKPQPFTPAEFNPLADERKKPVKAKTGVRTLKTIFVDRR
jgi:hypothetical protein